MFSRFIQKNDHGYTSDISISINPYSHYISIYFIICIWGGKPCIEKIFFLRDFAYYLDMQPSERVRVHGYSIKIFVFSTGIIVVNWTEEKREERRRDTFATQ